MTSPQLPTESLKDLAEQKEKEWRDIQHLRLVLNSVLLIAKLGKIYHVFFSQDSQVMLHCAYDNL